MESGDRLGDAIAQRRTGHICAVARRMLDILKGNEEEDLYDDPYRASRAEGLRR
jgi:hypothetical protein